LLALALRVDEEEFMKDHFKFPITGMRALHYPKAEELEEGEENVGLGAHADFSCTSMDPSAAAYCFARSLE
jgi:isopenicillin N synthase-like dioxygenase